MLKDRGGPGRAGWERRSHGIVRIITTAPPKTINAITRSMNRFFAVEVLAWAGGWFCLAKAAWVLILLRTTSAQIAKGRPMGQAA